MEPLIVFLLIVLVVGASALYTWYQEKKDDERYATEMKRRETELIGSLRSLGVNRSFYPKDNSQRPAPQSWNIRRYSKTESTNESFIADTGSDTTLPQTLVFSNGALNSPSYSDCGSSSDPSSFSDSSSSICD